MVYLIDAAVLVLLFILSFLLVREARKNHVLDSLQGSLQEKMLRRRDEEERKVLEDGNGQKTGFFYRMDLALLQSGIQKKIPSLTSEVFLVLLVFLSIVGFAIMFTVSKSLLLAFATTVGMLFLIYIFIEILLDRKTDKIEEDILKLANLLDNYSKSSDDIVVIMDHTWVYLNEPLCSAIRDCCTECRASGDIQTAFKRMELSVRHKQFGELARNIEMCSRYNANYSAVIRKNRDVLENYLAEKEACRQLANHSRINILVLYAGAALVLKMMESIGEDGIVHLLISSFAGNVILAACFFIILYSLRQMFLMGKGR